LASLFELIVPHHRVHTKFDFVRTHPGKASARAALNEAFSTFKDPDGHFVKEFQGDAFDARVFELYLHAYFSTAGFRLDREHPRPDFIVERTGLKVAVEATTTNPSQGGVLAKTAERVDDLDSPSEIGEYVDGEMAVRYSNSLREKLKKAYWNEAHVKDLPLVFAIETFHDPHALQLSDAGLTQYLYGLRSEPTMTEHGELVVDASEITSHRKATKVVDSGFFDQPGTERISAILFTNAGTIAKFSRMGYQAGFGRDSTHITRRGTSFDPEPSAMLPRFFKYDLDAAPRVETWGEGMVCFHNPNAALKLPNGYFPDAVDTRLIKGQIVSIHPAWHPFASTTNVIHDPSGNAPRPLLGSPVEIRAITKEAFQKLAAPNSLAAILYREEVWLADSSNSFLGVVVFDREDGDFGYAVLAPDERGKFRAIENDTGFGSRIEAAMEIWKHMERLLEQPQRIFPQ
jgi:hypothetical protein